MENQNDMKISVPKPCHEDWDKMQPNEKGAFCMKCAKTVVDFTKKTTDEIKDFLVEQAGKKICGRFLNDQLDDQPKKKIDLRIPLNLLPRKLSFNNAFLFALFIAFGTSLFSCKTTAGEVVGKISAIDTIEMLHSTAPPDYKITGDTIYEPVIQPVEKIETITGEIEEPVVKGEAKCVPKDTLNNEDVILGNMKFNKK